LTAAESVDCAAALAKQPAGARAALATFWPIHPAACTQVSVRSVSPLFPGTEETFEVRGYYDSDWEGFILDGALGPELDPHHYNQRVLRRGAGYNLVSARLHAPGPPTAYIKRYSLDPPHIEEVFMLQDLTGYQPNPSLETRRRLYPSGVARSPAGEVCDYREAEGKYTCVDCAPTVAAPEAASKTDSVSSVTSSLPPLVSGDACFDYYAWNLSDGLLSTSWQEAAPGSGVGQWVEFTFAAPADLSAVEIANGFQSTHPTYGDLFPLNGRVAKLAVAVNGQPAGELSLADDRAVQRLPLVAAGATVVRLTIDETLPGSRWADTALSEVRFIAAD
jgi:hypothetical protein